MATPDESSVQDSSVPNNQDNTPVADNEQNAETQAASQQRGEDNAHDDTNSRHKSNWNNGKRRIAQQQSLKARIKDLEAQLEEYRKRDDDYSKFKAESISERIDDMRAMSADAEATEFASRAEQWFGDETEQFMQQTYRYAAYVNANEPDLLRYANREYGPILLHEWYKRMDNPALRQQWLQMTTYEKGAVLNNFYNQIAKIVEYSQKPQGNGNTPPPKPASVPVPNGGRQSAASMPSDDFGIALGDAFNRHGARK